MLAVSGCSWLRPARWGTGCGPRRLEYRSRGSVGAGSVGALIGKDVVARHDEDGDGDASVRSADPEGASIPFSGGGGDDFEHPKSATTTNPRMLRVAVIQAWIVDPVIDFDRFDLDSRVPVKEQTFRCNAGDVQVRASRRRSG